jgi:hypothetical protein
MTGLGVNVKPFLVFFVARQEFVSHFHRARLSEYEWLSYLNFHHTYILHP